MCCSNFSDTGKYQIQTPVKLITFLYLAFGNGNFKL